MNTQTMNLSGGLQIYNNGKRHNEDTSPEGRKVYFLNKNGYEYELKEAREHFKEGQILTIKDIYMDRFTSEVEFIEYPNMKFNTVLFGDCIE